jgi:hypothetical protein
MPERAQVLQQVQVGVETTKGTSVAANKLFQDISINSRARLDVQSFTPLGQKFPSLIDPTKDWSEASISGALSYSEIIYLLSSLLTQTTPVQQGATTAYKWTFTPAAQAEDTVKSYTVEQGSSVRGQKFTYGMVTDLGCNFDRSGCTVSGSMIGRDLQDNITLTATPTPIVQRAVLPQDVDVFIDPTSGALGTTKYTRVFSGSLSIANRFSPLWVLDSTQSSWATHVESMPSYTIQLLMEADAQGMGLLASARARTTQFIRVQMQDSQLAGAGFPYKMQWDFAARLSEWGDFSDQDGVYAVSMTFTSVYDTGWAKAMTVAVTNAQTAL